MGEAACKSSGLEMGHRSIGAAYLTKVHEYVEHAQRPSDGRVDQEEEDIHEADIPACSRVTRRCCTLRSEVLRSGTDSE